MIENEKTLIPTRLEPENLQFATKLAAFFQLLGNGATMKAQR